MFLLWDLCEFVIDFSSHEIATQSSHSVDRAGRQTKMASIEFWIPWRSVYKPHCGPNSTTSLSKNVLNWPWQCRPHSRTLTNDHLDYFSSRWSSLCDPRQWADKWCWFCIKRTSIQLQHCQQIHIRLKRSLQTSTTKQVPVRFCTLMYKLTIS